MEEEEGRGLRVRYCSREPLRAGRLLSGPRRGSARCCPLLPEARSSAISLLTKERKKTAF